MIIKSLKERIAIYIKINKHFKQMTQPVLMICAFKIIAIFILMGIPILYKYLIDEVFLNKNIEVLTWICTGYIVLFILKCINDFFILKITNKINNKSTFDLRRKIWIKIEEMPYEEFEKQNTADLKLKIDNDVTNIKELITGQIVDYIIAILASATYLISLFFIDWKLTLISSSMIPIVIIIGAVVGNWSASISERFRGIYSSFCSWEYSTILLWKEIKELTLEKTKALEFIRHRHKIAKIQVERNIKSFFPRVVVLPYLHENFITKVFIYFVGGIFILNGEMTIGAIFMFINYYKSLFDNILLINQKTIEFKNYSPSLSRVFDMLESQPIHYNQRDSTHNDNRNSVLSVKNINYRYGNQGRDVIKNVSFDIQKGDVILLVGRSGSGKTTLVKLLLKLYEPQHGSITYYGENIRDIKGKTYYQNITAVMQDGFLFNLSIRENLLLANPNLGQKEIEVACKAANVHDSILRMEDRYETIIGEKGVKLSGGQKQGLAIAQALLRNSHLIIFDEATSAIDYKSEQVINRTIESQSKEKAIIVISHRLSSVIKANKVILIDDGEIQLISENLEEAISSDSYKRIYKISNK